MCHIATTGWVGRVVVMVMIVLIVVGGCGRNGVVKRILIL